MLLGKRIQLPIIPGVNPISDSTELDTVFFTSADKVRFQGGKLRKLKGWQRIFPANNMNVTGFCRNVFSYRDAFDNTIEIFGTNTRLFAYFPTNGDFFYNITPLQTATTNIPNSLSTEYNSAVVVQLQTTAGSPTVNLYINNYFDDNELITISSVVGGPFGGIPAASLEGSFPVQVVNSSEITFTVPTLATATGVFAVTMTWASDYLYVNFPANGLPLGDRIKIQLSTDVDGIPAADINVENIITNIVDADNFVIQTGITATSKVISGGGAATTIQQQITAGAVDQDEGNGFGSNQFGLGLFGADLPNTSKNITFPRIWSMDNFGANLILTPGDPASSSTDNLYYWTNDIKVAPQLVSSVGGASDVPLGVRWVYVSSNAVVALGAGGVLNQFNSSDTESFINWTPGPASNAFSIAFQQSGAFTSQSKARNFDLLFTQSEVYLIDFVGKPDIWVVRKLFGTDGIIGPKARAVIEDAVFWMGNGDFYVFDGYTVNVLPNNTLKRFVYDNINFGQASKCFVYANVEYSEVSFYFPFGQDTECNNYVTYNYKEGHYTTGTMSRSAAEERTNALGNPILVQSDNIVTNHIPNSIQSYFFDLANNPLTTTSSSALVIMAIQPNVYLQAGDQIFISGATDTGGILAANLNGERTITSTSSIDGFGSGQFGAGQFGAGAMNQSITFQAGTSATSSATGGGAAVTVGTAIIGVTYANASQLSVNQLIFISGAQGVDGFNSFDVNTTNPVRYINGNVVEINIQRAHVFSTSAVVGGGGAGAELTFEDSAYVFKHDYGLNDYNVNFNIYKDLYNEQYIPMLSFATTNFVQIEEGDNTMLILSLYPDIKMQGNMTVTVNVREFAQSPQILSQSFTMTPVTTKIDPMMIGRERQYTFTSNVLNGDFLMGKLYEEVKASTPR